MYKLAIILLRDSINQSTENIRFLSYLIFSVYKFAITYLPRPLPPASYAVAHGYMWDAHFDKFAQKVKMWFLHRMMCKSMRMQALDTIVPFYAVLLASAQLLPYCPVLAHHYLPTHPPLHASWHAADVAGGCVAWTRWFVPWLQLERPIHPQRRLSANFKPPSCYFITVNLVIFISGHSDYYNCHAIYSKDIWCPLLSLGYRMTRGWAPATLHFGRIIDSENFQPSSKLCRFAGTKVNSKIPHNWLLFATGSGNSVDLCWSKPVCQIFNSFSKPWHSE